MIKLLPRLAHPSTGFQLTYHPGSTALAVLVRARAQGHGPAVVFPEPPARMSALRDSEHAAKS